MNVIAVRLVTERAETLDSEKHHHMTRSSCAFCCFHHSSISNVASSTAHGVHPRLHPLCCWPAPSDQQLLNPEAFRLKLSTLVTQYPYPISCDAGLSRQQQSGGPGQRCCFCPCFPPQAHQTCRTVSSSNNSSLQWQQKQHRLFVARAVFLALCWSVGQLRRTCAADGPLPRACGDEKKVIVAKTSRQGLPSVCCRRL